VEGYRTRLTGLTPEEAERSSCPAIPGRRRNLAWARCWPPRSSRSSRLCRPELRSRAARLKQRFHLDAPGWFQEPDATPHLQQIAEAVWADRRLSMHYRRGSDDGWSWSEWWIRSGSSSRPGAWYLVGADVDGGMRTYRVSRIVDLALEDRFERPDDFDLAEYWDRSVAEYAESLPVRFRGEAIERLSDAVGQGHAGEAMETATPADEDGWRTASITLEDLWHAEAQILHLGADIEIIEPPELRERVAAAARAMAAIYR
jgi:predicted DNA-binding transcriptional regulator YafY